MKYTNSYKIIYPSAYPSFDVVYYEKSYKKIKSKLKTHKVKDKSGHSTNFLFAFCYIAAVRKATNILILNNKLEALIELEEEILIQTKKFFKYEIKRLNKSIQWLGSNQDQFGRFRTESNFTIEFLPYNLEIDCIYVLSQANYSKKSISSMLMIYNFMLDTNIETSLRPLLSDYNEKQESFLKNIFLSKAFDEFSEDGYLRLPDISKYDSSNLKNKNLGKVLLTKYYVLTIISRLEELYHEGMLPISDEVLFICFEILKYLRGILNSNTDAEFSFYNIDISELYHSTLGNTNNTSTTNDRLKKVFPSVRLLIHNILDEGDFNDHKLLLKRYKKLLAETYQNIYNTIPDENLIHKELYSNDITDLETLLDNLDRFWCRKKQLYILDCLILEKITGLKIKDKDYLSIRMTVNADSHLS